jgi:membrane protein implicated in regulation of membrane protease activity
MEWWIWIVLGLGLLVAEMLIPGLFLLFFGLGALLVGALVLLGAGGPKELQWLLFSGFSLGALALLRRRLRSRLARKPVVDSLVGELAVPLEDLPAQATGKAELRGSAWSARNDADVPLSRGQRCQVVRVEGLMLWIRPEAAGRSSS